MATRKTEPSREGSGSWVTRKYTLVRALYGRWSEALLEFVWSLSAEQCLTSLKVNAIPLQFQIFSNLPPKLS